MNEVTQVLQNEVLVERFSQVAPKWMAFEAEKAFAIQHLDNNDYLRKVANENPRSLLQAMSNVAACGLSLNPAKKEAYLVPRKGKICFDPDFRGLCKLATDTKSIVWVHADVVRENDRFVNQGIGEKPIHEFEPFGKSRGAVVGAFCTAKVHDGSFLTEIMDVQELESIRNNSDGYKSGSFSPWKTHPEEMMKKTVIKRAHKRWPRSDQVDIEGRLAQAVDISHQNDGYELATSTPDLGQYSDEAKKYFDQLIEQGDAEGMVVFQFSKDEKEWTNLYHSFPKGQKGKYQKIVDDLYNKGMSMVADYANLINEAAANGNEDDIADYIADMGELRPLVEKRVTNEAAMAMRAA